MASLRTHQRRDTVKWVIAFILIAALIVGLAIALVKIDKQVNTVTLRSSAYEIGTLNESGQAAKNTGYIVTKDYVPADGLKVTLKSKADIQYKLFFYSENSKGEKEYVSATDMLSADFAGTIPENAKFVKIVIQPIGDAEVSLLEINGYASQLTVVHNK